MAKKQASVPVATSRPTAPEPAALKKSPPQQITAVEMGARQREISVSEFFTKNRHLLGFDNPRKALLTCVKEAVDNALDACEEAGILPDVSVKLEVVSNGEPVAPSQAGKFRITVTDNGPGIIRQHIPRIFAKLLYGSKFHRMRMSRGQQGIGISAAGMYGQLTTGKPVKIISRTGPRAAAHLTEPAPTTSAIFFFLSVMDQEPKLETASACEGKTLAMLWKPDIFRTLSIPGFVEMIRRSPPLLRVSFTAPSKARSPALLINSTPVRSTTKLACPSLISFVRTRDNSEAVSASTLPVTFMIVLLLSCCTSVFILILHPVS